MKSKKVPTGGLDEWVLNVMHSAEESAAMLSLNKLFTYLQALCETAEKPVILIIDEVDSATNNKVFLDFLVNMSFSADDITGMLKEYEVDYHTGMDIVKNANLIYDYTSGYLFLVSRI